MQWHPTPVLLPGKSHGRRSLVGCSPWGPEELDTTEQLHFHALQRESIYSHRVACVFFAHSLESRVCLTHLNHPDITLRNSATPIWLLYSSGQRQPLTDMQEATNFGGSPIFILKLEYLSLKKNFSF